VLYRGSDLQHLAASPDGKCFAAASGGQSIVLLCGGKTRAIPISGVTELDWSHSLIAAKGPELWRIPLEDGAAPVQLDTPGNRRPGFSVHPDGNRIALTVSDARSEVRSMMLP
jgi:hypothetical protein